MRNLSQIKNTMKSALFEYHISNYMGLSWSDFQVTYSITQTSAFCTHIYKHTLAREH